jgi:hypothetical protein
MSEEEELIEALRDDTVLSVNKNKAADTIERLQARVKALEVALQAAADSMTCKGNGPDAAHYCPNCDNNMYGPRDRARTTLQGYSK